MTVIVAQADGARFAATPEAKDEALRTKLLASIVTLFVVIIAIIGAAKAIWRTKPKARRL